MKNLILIVGVILCMVVPVWACEEVVEPIPIQQQQQQQQFQQQGQKQFQGQDQNNYQVIAPSQNMVVKNPRQFANIPSVGVAELNFGNGGMNEFKLPARFKGVVLLKETDTIHHVVDVGANIPFKKLYKTILRMAEDHKVQGQYLRFQIIRMDGQKSWTTGGSLVGGGTGVSGTTGLAGSMALVPMVGGTKAHPLFTVICVNVVE